MTLRKTNAGAFAFFALASVAQAADMQPVLKAPGAVDQQATGYVEVYGGWTSTKSAFDGSDSLRFDGWALGGAGRGNYWVNPGMSVQVDAQAEGTSYEDRPSGHFSTHSYLAGGHWTGAIRSNICSACSEGSVMRAAPALRRLHNGMA